MLPVSRLALLPREDKTAACGPGERRGVAREREVPRSEGEGAGSRVYQAYACAHAAGRAELRGEGATAEEVSLFRRSGRSVAARVATEEVGRDRPCEAVEILSLSAPAHVADSGDARSPCVPGPPAALQVGASGFPVPGARGGPGLDWCYRGYDPAPGVPALPHDNSLVLALTPCGAGARAGWGRYSHQVRSSSGPGGVGHRGALPHAVLLGEAVPGSCAARERLARRAPGR